MTRYLLLLCASPAGAQGLLPPPPDYSAAISAAIAPLAAKTDLPQPANTVGPGEMVGGQVGNSMAYKRGDWVPPRISRTGSCTLNASGMCTLAWSSAFPAGVTPVMLGDPSAINTSAAQPIDCDVTSPPTIVSVPIKCWLAQNTVLGATLLNIAGATVAPFSATLIAGVTVTASAIPASQ